VAAISGRRSTHPFLPPLISLSMNSLTASIRTTSILLAFAMPLTLHAETSAGTDGGINLPTSDCGIELMAPKHVCRNVDDDQPGEHEHHEKWDTDHDPSEGENDLQELKIRGSTTEDGVKMFLKILKGDEKVKFWENADKTGALDPKDFEWDVPTTSRTVTFFVEGFDTGVVEFEATITCGASPVFATIKVYEIDLDIDSLNDNGYEAKDYTDPEDMIEASENRQGKILVAAPLEDFDNDGIPDHADMDITGKQFVPVQVKLKDPINLASANITFIYPASIPLAVQGDGGQMPTQPTRGLRLWKKNAAAAEEGQQARTLDDFIPPGTSIPWSSVFDSGSSVTNSQILYLEYVEGEGDVTQGRQTIKITTTGTEIPLEDTVNVYLHPLFTLDAAIAPFASQPALPEDHEGAVPAHETDPGSLVIAPIKGRAHPGTRSELKLKITGASPTQGQFSLTAENLDQLEIYDAPQGGNLVDKTTWSASEFPGEITFYVASKPFEAQQQPQNGLLTFAYQPESASDPIWVSLDDQVRVRLEPAYSDLSIPRYGNEADLAEEHDDEGNAATPPHEMDPGGIVITGEDTDMGITSGTRARLTLAALTPDSMTGTYALASNNLPDLVFYQNATGDALANLVWTEANFAGGNKVVIYAGCSTLPSQSPPQIGTLTFTSELKPYDGDTSYKIADTVAVTLSNPVDLDVDSNNNEGFIFTHGHPNEDKIEASTNSSEPGKIIAVPVDPDADKDGIPDFRDFDGIASTKFVPIVVNLPLMYDPDNTVMVFDYKMSPVNNAGNTDSGFRIWTQDAIHVRGTDPMPDTPAAGNNPTSYLIKSGESVPWSRLVANTNPAAAGHYSGPAIILYIETVLTSGASGIITQMPFDEKEPIKITATMDSSSGGISTEDAVNIAVRCTGGVTLTGTKAIVVNDNDDNNDEYWDYMVDDIPFVDPDLQALTVKAIALDQPVTVTIRSESLRGLGSPGTPATGGLIDGFYPGLKTTYPGGTTTGSDNDGKSKTTFLSAPYTFTVPANTTITHNLFFEGQRNSAAVDDVVIEAVIETSSIEAGSPPCLATTGAEHKLTVYQIDIDLDSNNNEGYAFDPGSADEDRIESSPARPGKILAMNILDKDYDGVPDFADGYDIEHDAGVNESGAGKSNVFVPMFLEIKEPIDLASATLKFSYSASDPSGIGRTGAGTPASPFVCNADPSGKLRLWTKNGDEERKKASVADSTTAGNYVPSHPSTQIEIPANAFGFDRVIPLYLEAIAGSAAIGDLDIMVEIDPDGPSGPIGYLANDLVKVTVVQVEVVHPLAADFGTDPTKHGRVLISTNTADPDRWYSDYQTNDTEILVTAYITPKIEGVPVFFEVIDPDDLSPYDGRTTAQSGPASDPQDTNPNDNHDPNKTMSGATYETYQSNCLSARKDDTELKTIHGVTGAVAETTLRFTDRYSGDNYRIRAVCRDPNNQPFDSRSGTTSINTDSLDLNKVTTGIKPASNPLIHESLTLVAWKRFYIEYDQMYKMGGTILATATNAGGNTEITVDDVSDFSMGQTVAVFDNAGNTQTVKIKSSPSTTSPYTIEVDPLTGVYPRYSGVRPILDAANNAITGAGDVYEIPNRNMEQGYGGDTLGTDGGCFAEFKEGRVPGSGFIPKYTLFPSSTIGLNFSNHWYNNAGDNSNIFQIVSARDDIGGAFGYAAFERNATCIFHENHSSTPAHQLDQHLRETTTHELGHLSGELQQYFKWYVDDTVDHPNHSKNPSTSPGDQCVMSYNRDRRDGIMEFGSEALKEIRKQEIPR